MVADSKDEAENAVIEQGGIDEIKWAEGYHKDEPVEVYANDYNSDYDRDTERAWKVAECVPYEDNDSIDFEDPNWTTDDYEWTKTGDEQTETKTKNNMEVPF